MPVRFLTLIAGGLLVALGAAAAALSASGSVTAWIPAFLGLPLVLLGLVAFKPEFRAAAVHVALVLGVLGAAAGLWKLVEGVVEGGGSNLAAVSQLGMFVVCAAYVTLGVRSFLAARRARKQATA